MKILVRSSDKAVIHADPSLTLTAFECRGDGWRDGNFNMSNAAIREADLPEHFTGAAWGYDGAWFAIDQAAIDAQAELDKPPVPSVVSKFQAKAALLHFGYLDAVEAIMANPATPAIAKLAWSEAQEFLRDSPTVAMMAGALGLTAAQVDDLFRFAATVTA